MEVPRQLSANRASTENAFSRHGHYGDVTTKLPDRMRLLAPVDVLVRGVWDVPAAIGGRATGERLERMRRSPQYRDGAFHNAVPSTVVPAGNGKDIGRELLRGRALRRPSQPIPIVRPTAADLAAPPLDGRVDERRS